MKEFTNSDNKNAGKQPQGVDSRTTKIWIPGKERAKTAALDQSGQQPAQTRKRPSQRKPAAQAQKPTAKQAAAPAAQPSAPTAGRVLHRVRGYMNCVERVRRENSMLAPFMEGGKLFLDDQGRAILQLADSFQLMMADTPEYRRLLCRALAPELKKTPSPAELILEAPDETVKARDTVLDDLLEAAGENNHQ